jgi:2-polyprenyl-6-methoxyphenol hydroxylase-like FAD-dependent oxidoreductase
MVSKDGRVAVIGASMAGLLAARGLADIASEVLIIERDALPEQPEARKGVPQGRHAHALLRAGALIIEDLFPGLIQDLVARGAQRLFWLASGMWWQFDGYRVRGGDDFELTTFTRPFLEDAIRERVAALPNVRMLSGVSARGVLGCDQQVKGVALGNEGNAGESSLDADLVVDASGRGSQATAWLKALGCQTDAGVQRRGAERPARASLRGPAPRWCASFALRSRRRSTTKTCCTKVH